MSKITSISDLKNAIQELEYQRVEEWPLLKDQFRETYEFIKPVNLIKSSFSELTSSAEFKDNIMNTALSLVAGYLSKKVAVGSTHNPLKQLLGTFLQMGVTNVVSENADEIKLTIRSIINTVFNRKQTPTE